MNNLTNVVAKVATVCDRVPTSAKENQNSTASKGIVEGIIAGTKDGLVIIPLNTWEQRTISSHTTNGLAFNWRSRKVYWIQSGAGIMTAQLDGSKTELLVADTSYLCGLAVDQITGNFYYGASGYRQRIRSCDSMGKKCVTIVSGVNNVGEYIWDIVLYPSEGPFNKKSVTQANMDGTNATVIILENVFGLYLGDFTEKLYWAGGNGKRIGRYDLNLDSQHVHFNVTSYPMDIAVDGDTMYFSGSYPTSWDNTNWPTGVYSVTDNGKVSSILNATGNINYIALYGRNKVFSRSNPCKDSPCTNLCVLTRVSYTCL